MKTLREMQDSLYAKAKTEKNAKFNTLMDKICRTDVLKEAWNPVYFPSSSQNLSTSFRYMFARSGDMTPPCGVPRVGYVVSPSYTTIE